MTSPLDSLYTVSYWCSIHLECLSSSDKLLLKTDNVRFDLDLGAKDKFMYHLTVIQPSRSHNYTTCHQTKIYYRYLLCSTIATKITSIHSISDFTSNYCYCSTKQTTKKLHFCFEGDHFYLHNCPCHEDTSHK